MSVRGVSVLSVHCIVCSSGIIPFGGELRGVTELSGLPSRTKPIFS